MNEKGYYRVMLGPKSLHANDCRAGGFVGADYGLNEDLSGRLPETWQEFNKVFVPVFLKSHADKSKIAAGLACGTIYNICKGMQNGDIVLCPNGSGHYLVGEVDGDYQYRPREILPHRRPVRWYDVLLARSAMSQALQNSAGGPGTLARITQHAPEIEILLGGRQLPRITTTDDTIEDPAVFALEKHLEDFLVQNWQQTELGKKYDVFEDDGELVGRQYPSDTGPIDILAISKDKTELLVVELKKGRASDYVVGQVQRYMGFVIEELAESNQSVRGAIIALEDDKRIRRALSAASNIDFYTYSISFKLNKV